MSDGPEPPDNAEVDYVDAATGAVLYTLPFHDPSWPQMSYGCGRPLAVPRPRKDA